MQNQPVHHIGITVKDLDRSLEWYNKMLGITPEAIGGGSGPSLSTGVGIPDVSVRFAFLHFPNCVIELMDYSTPRRIETFERSIVDTGSAHVCIEVPDIHESYSSLAKRGVDSFLSEPVKIEGGMLDGAWFVYFQDPDGIILELFQSAATHVTGH
jgi:catechol 2,3-dioxygenase-like lactoylglutathione lyase family enzyme